MKYCQPTTTMSDSTMARMVFLCSIIQRSCGGNSGATAVRAAADGRTLATASGCGAVWRRGGRDGEPVSCRRSAAGATSSPALEGGNPAERRIEFLHHFAKRSRERGPPPDEHVIVAGTQFTGTGRRHAHDLPQPTPHAVALHSIADLFRYGKSDTEAPWSPRERACNTKRAAGRPHPVCRGAKIISAFQPLNDEDGTGVPITH